MRPVVCFRRKLIEEVEGTSVGNLGFVITVTEVCCEFYFLQTQFVYIQYHVGAIHVNDILLVSTLFLAHGLSVAVLSGHEARERAPL